MKITSETQNHFNKLIEIAHDLAQKLLNELNAQNIDQENIGDYFINKASDGFLKKYYLETQFSEILAQFTAGEIPFDDKILSGLATFRSALIYNLSENRWEYDINELIKSLNKSLDTSEPKLEYTGTQFSEQDGFILAAQKDQTAQAAPAKTLVKNDQTCYYFLLQIFVHPYTKAVLAVIFIAGLAAAMLALGALTGPAGWLAVAVVTAAILHTTPAALGIAGAVVSVASGLVLGLSLFNTKSAIKVSVKATYEGEHAANVLKITISVTHPSEPATEKIFFKYFDRNDYDGGIISDKIGMELFDPLFVEYPELRWQLFALELNYYGRLKFGTNTNTGSIHVGFVNSKLKMHGSREERMQSVIEYIQEQERNDEKEETNPENQSRKPN